MKKYGSVYLSYFVLGGGILVRIQLHIFDMYSRRDNTPPEYLNSFFLHIKLREVHEGVTSE